MGFTQTQRSALSGRGCGSSLVDGAVVGPHAQHAPLAVLGQKVGVAGAIKGQREVTPGIIAGWLRCQGFWHSGWSVGDLQHTVTTLAGVKPVSSRAAQPI